MNQSPLVLRSILIFLLTTIEKICGRKNPHILGSKLFVLDCLGQRQISSSFRFAFEVSSGREGRIYPWIRKGLSCDPRFSVEGRKGNLGCCFCANIRFSQRFILALGLLRPKHRRKQQKAKGKAGPPPTCAAIRNRHCQNIHRRFAQSGLDCLQSSLGYCIFCI